LHIPEKDENHIQIHLKGGPMAKKVEEKAAKKATSAAKKATKKEAKTAAKAKK
jgi:hypothetical protein